MSEGVLMVGDELRLDVAFWKARVDNGDQVPSFVKWEFDDIIDVGELIGTWMFPDGTETSFSAPDDCHGTITDLNEQVDFDVAHRKPAQWLLRFDVAIED
jgi:hypothetical protein